MTTVPGSRYHGKPASGVTMTFREMKARHRAPSPTSDDITIGRTELYRLSRYLAFDREMAAFQVWHRDRGAADVDRTIVAYGIEDRGFDGFAVTVVDIADIPSTIVAFEDTYSAALDVEMNLDDDRDGMPVAG